LVLKLLAAASATFHQQTARTYSIFGVKGLKEGLLPSPECIPGGISRSRQVEVDGGDVGLVLQLLAPT
jgi:hypothetical protein